jgi:hypothetical protein
MATLTPLRRYRTPAYPTVEGIREHPELLEARPRGWARRGLTPPLVGLALGVLPACGSTTSQTEPVESPAASVDASAGETAAPAASADAATPAAGDATADAAVTAPTADASASPAQRPTSPAVQGRAMVFEAGDGRGAVGCVAIAPPVFLTEAEAWDVIADELSRAGVTLGRGGVSLPNVRTPVFEMCGGQTGTSAPGALQLDGSDQARHVAVEFVSAEDHDQYWDSQSMCSVQDYRFLEAARAIATELGQPQNLVVGVFYDPSTSVCYRGACPGGVHGYPTEEAARAKSLSDLRGQVQQFVRFLRSSGAI